jgi:predicted ATPase
MQSDSTNRFVVISGCSGGGKSTLLSELARRGYAVVEEPGRRIVREEAERGGSALPWQNMNAFLRRAISMAHEDRFWAASQPGWVFFDRGLVDAAAALQALTGESVLASLGHSHRYHRRVFLAPPWPKIFVADAERQHGFESAVEEYTRLADSYPWLGYETVILPRTAVEERADFVLKMLGVNQE